ncbi:MAG TPA: hypothetical protein VFL29_09295 [Candidatus Dormibacteraeota bacterium]|nr:hypothetical protein [Candidatus Dormibacteraeota bacterium]
MNRPAMALGSAACVLGAALVVGGKGGLVGGSLAIVVLAAGAIFGIPAFITTAGALLAGTYLIALVLQQAPLDLSAPLVGTLVLLAMELGHLSLEEGRYSLPGGNWALAMRASITAGVCVVGFGVAWLVLIGAFWVPAPAGTISVLAGVAAVLAVIGLLIVLGRTSDERA